MTAGQIDSSSCDNPAFVTDGLHVEGYPLHR